MRKIKILSITILLIIAFGIINTVNGAIAIKEAGNTVLTGKTISKLFDMAKQMTDEGQALEGTSLDPHMATNKEWAAVSYLSNSNYGTAGEGKNTGMTVIINGNSHYSTNDNITGVMDFGKNSTYTAAIIAGYLDKLTNEDTNKNGKSLIENAADTSKVDLSNVSNATEKYAIQKWFGAEQLFDEAAGIKTAQPFCWRKGLFSGYWGARQLDEWRGNYDFSTSTLIK